MSSKERVIELIEELDRAINESRISADIVVEDLGTEKEAVIFDPETDEEYGALHLYR